MVGSTRRSAIAFTRSTLSIGCKPSGLGTPAGAPGPGRSISPNYIEDVLNNTQGIPVKGPAGEARLSYLSGSVQVITEDGIVITVITR
jgi:hypothetical protein